MPRIPTCAVAMSIVVLFLARMGSLNAQEQTKKSRSWRRFLGRELHSADSSGRIAALVDPESVRQLQHEVYARLKRNRALSPTTHGLTVLVLDAHESHATYRRRCSGCLERRVGKRTQYYHRAVTGMLLSQPFPVLLDAEPIQPGEGEIAAALRLLERLLRSYPRAFDVVAGDALYSDPCMHQLLLQHGKDVVTVLKKNTPDLLKDAEALFETTEPSPLWEDEAPKKQHEVWDLEGFTTWPQAKESLRVVRHRRTEQIRRQLTGEIEDEVSTMIWVTTLSSHRAPTEALVRMGRGRWDIENKGFNETVNRWFSDHVYKHEATAMLVFWLLAMVAFNLFYAFFFRNLKPEYRKTITCLHLAVCLRTEIYEELPETRAPT